MVPPSARSGPTFSCVPALVTGCRYSTLTPPVGRRSGGPRGGGATHFEKHCIKSTQRHTNMLVSLSTCILIVILHFHNISIHCMLFCNNLTWTWMAVCFAVCVWLYFMLCSREGIMARFVATDGGITRVYPNRCVMLYHALDLIRTLWSTFWVKVCVV